MSDGGRYQDRTFILGLDGVPWELIAEWANAGELPAFRRVIEEGAAGPLRSTKPASTPLAWPSIATGVLPDRHGVYGFQRVTSEHTHEMYTSDHVREVELWDVMTPAVVGNVPMTYPVDEVDGKMVAGMLSPGVNERFAHPPELVDAIEREIPDYRIGLTWAEYAGRERELLDDVASLLEARRELMRLLMETEDWQLFFFTYTEPDRLQHLVWEESKLLDHYRSLDDILGEVLDYVRTRDATLYVVSDHGFGPISNRVVANGILEREGYLTRKWGGNDNSVLQRVGFTKSNVSKLMNAIGIDEHAIARKYLPRSVADFAASAVPGDHFLYDVDHAETTAFAHEHGNVYVNDSERFTDGPVDPAEVPSVKRDLTSTFRAVTDPATGERVLEVHDGDELFPRDPNSPDLVLEPKQGYGVSFSLSDAEFVTPDANADHHEEGIFLAWGPNVAAGTRPREATVVDVAPTVLHASGHPIPESADGRVMREIFTRDSPPAVRTVETKRYNETGSGSGVDDDFGQVKERLRGLGYVE